MKLLSCLTAGKRRWLINQINIKLNISQGDRVDEANISRDDQVGYNTFTQDRVPTRIPASCFS